MLLSFTFALKIQIYEIISTSQFIYYQLVNAGFF
ncbi:hypothetical protein SAMN05421855_1011174 [Ulvibacter litoralis]|uniref:Uncharacterized protein n=1 Tax=Ulvibacter litoralis TaxID=227084 RepID=A0A1G7DUC8_9FLAO|nr:hypothetical protein SAMN05421855_1011174 [Ulvibacter litoralis]